ncbi:hypothetical protein ACFXG4_43850 [Nocardia sp. NPDC059246]|uniref:hypothetical protein n=1 Tax=unclassified Nocardia TaxID=2637762 RepID=UPI0036C22EBB
MNRPSDPCLLTTRTSVADDSTHWCTVGGEIDAVTAPAFHKARPHLVGPWDRVG